MKSKLLLYLNTIRFLKPSQIYYRLYFYVKGRFGSFKSDFDSEVNLTFVFLKYTPFLNLQTYNGNNTFYFLNISHQFPSKIDWDLKDYGKLWQYNLFYFNYLHQPNLNKVEGEKLIHSFLDAQSNLKSSNEPYPISLRVINWIKFICINKIEDVRIINSIFIQTKELSKKIEFHILGNHLLENAFCLLHAGYFFKDENFIEKAKNILFKELNEQILDDGAHYELSPMYHQIILFRLLEAIDFLRINELEEVKLIKLMEVQASKMLSWLNIICFKDGSFPMLNDATTEIAPTTFELNKFGSALNLDSHKYLLTKSGYRKFESKKYELIIDIGQIGPTYQPGHAHADTFNFVLNLNGLPLIVDTGTSTYEKNGIRQMERSTCSHNTVVVNNKNSSEVWGGFRVARRAKVEIIKDDENMVLAKHNGYQKYGIIHERKWEIFENLLTITDNLIGNAESAKAFFHFYPNTNLQIVGNQVLFNNGRMLFDLVEDIYLEKYNFAVGFNKLVSAQKIVVVFKATLVTQIALD